MQKSLTSKDLLLILKSTIMTSILPFSEVFFNLKKQGYTVSFSLAENGLSYSAGNSIISPDEFIVDAHYKVASMFDPLEIVTIYAISSEHNNLKGFFMSSEDIANLSFSPEMAEIFNPDCISEAEEKRTYSGAQSTIRATKSRPEGTRALNQEMLTFDTDALISQIKSEEAWSRSDRNSLTIFKNDSLCMVIVGLHPEAAMKKHSATGAITVQVLQGDIIFETLNQKSELTRGKMIALPAGIPHQVYAVKESFFLLTLALQK